MQDSFIDIGANLTDQSFDQDRDKIIEDSFQNGIEQIIVTSSSVNESLKSIELARSYKGKIWATAGIHPHNASNASENFKDDLMAILNHDEVVAIGECGLDYFRNFSSKEEQRKIFKGHLELAHKVDLPLFLHQRDAHDDFLGMIKDYGPKELKGVAHCFTGSKEQMESYLDLGLYIGVTGWLCDSRRNSELLGAINYIPKDRLLIETDSPYLMPKSLSKSLNTRRNEPQFLGYIAKELATLMEISLSELSSITRSNTKNLFAKLRAF
ncbi:MAG: 3'-5' ssDNA/RNA exonuclease TatD [Gammaproteobacteria bacterium]|jgi:TatD DNase family protein|nr:MAG: 3'-5' ssDNA/RNA exonuclease TatD [Gammaproteobacteria bacterium]